MPIILHIETATRVCSVGLSKDGSLIALRESMGDYSHSSLLTVYIDEVLKEAGISVNAVNAIAVSKGPGSYTGLRIGVSAAKGLCYALDKPLIAVGTLKSMTVGVREAKQEHTLYCPMLDARRMEVYCAIYDKDLNPVKEVSAEIIDESSFSEQLAKNKIVFFGDGASKCREILGKHSNVLFMDDVFPSAKNMICLAEEKFRKKEFEDIAYFEPFYLKDFIPGKPNVKGLR